MGAGEGRVTYYVYTMASRRNGTLYVGVTNDLVRRAFEHREGLVPGFTRKYDVKRLVHFEPHADVRRAIQREKNLERWNRAWKLALVERANPAWDDLYETIAR
jgi:putative endonuclease